MQSSWASLDSRSSSPPMTCCRASWPDTRRRRMGWTTARRRVVRRRDAQLAQSIDAAWRDLRPAARATNATLYFVATMVLLRVATRGGPSVASLLLIPVVLFAMVYVWLLFRGPFDRDFEIQRSVLNKRS